MYKRIIVLIIFVFCIIYTSVSISYEDLSVPETIKIEVKGNIENPGVYELNVGSNINDLLNIIKLRQDSDTSKLSLLHVLKNNEIIEIPKKNDSNLISINSANLYELSVLPGIGKSTAIKIIEYRDKYGSFLTLEDIKNVSGIGDKKYEKIKQYICL